MRQCVIGTQGSIFTQYFGDAKESKEPQSRQHEITSGPLLRKRRDNHYKKIPFYDSGFLSELAIKFKGSTYPQNTIIH